MKKNLHLIIMWYNFLKMAKKKKRRKFYIDSQTEKTIVTIFAVSFILITTLIFNRVVAGKILKQVQKESRTDCQNIVSGYAEAIKFCLMDYFTIIDSYSHIDSLETGDVTLIHKQLQEFHQKIPSKITSLAYVTFDYMAYISNGLIREIGTKELVDAHKENLQLYNISDPEYQEGTGEIVFYISKLIYDKDSKPSAIIAQCISVSTLKDLISNIKIGTKGYAFLMDSKGRFITHPDSEYIMKSFEPTDERYSYISSAFLSREKIGLYHTKNTRNEEIELTITPIQGTNWIVGLSIPTTQIQELPNMINRSSRFLFIIIALSIIFFTIIEIFVSKFFHKHQRVTTTIDPLTKLWTREKFEREAKRIIRFNPNKKFMLIESDIRGFKFINQNYGELMADKLIIQFSKILNKQILRVNGIMGRGFADHFYSLVKISSVQQAMRVFQQNLEEVNAQIKKFDTPFIPKFGISFVLPQGKNNNVTIQTLIGQASFAKSTIKDNMLKQFSIYNSRLLNKINKEQYIENNMKAALENKEFFVMYQPKIDLTTDKIVGAEALVRWNNPKFGMMAPNDFIPLFERNGFIKKLDFYVYDMVFDFIQRQIDSGNHVVPISVNMSRNHSKPEKFMHDFMEIFNKYSIPPSFIQVEIIERSFMDNNTLKEITDLLHKEGFSVAMDDFGSGESSLNMLTKIPVDVLKFDRTFLLSFTNNDGALNKDAESVLELLIDLSKTLKKETVFEGVETIEQRDFLKSIDCDQAQGFFYSRPLSESDFMNYLSEEK